MSTTTSNETAFYLDQEHPGVRYSVVLILLIAFVGSFAAINAALREAYPTLNTTVILACLGAIPVTLLFSAMGEWLLKRTWRSGRILKIGSNFITLQSPGRHDRLIDCGKNVNQLWWRLPLAGYPRGGRERRIPASWYCLAGQLQQDDTRIVVYCYAPARHMRTWLDHYEFEKLKPEDVYDTSFAARLGSPRRPEVPPEVVAGKQGRFWLAERNRWREGVELTHQDFRELLKLVRAR